MLSYLWFHCLWRFIYIQGPWVQKLFSSIALCSNSIWLRVESLILWKNIREIRDFTWKSLKFFWFILYVLVRLFLLMLLEQPNLGIGLAIEPNLQQIEPYQFSSTIDCHTICVLSQLHLTFCRNFTLNKFSEYAIVVREGQEGISLPTFWSKRKNWLKGPPYPRHSIFKIYEP